jgi:hypothetical protein
MPSSLLTADWRSQPEDWGVLGNRARAYIAKKDFGRAIKDCDTVIRLNPSTDVGTAKVGRD